MSYHSGQLWERKGQAGDEPLVVAVTATQRSPAGMSSFPVLIAFHGPFIVAQEIFFMQKQKLLYGHLFTRYIY